MASTDVSLRRTLRVAGLVLLVLFIAFPVVWVLFIASGTTFGSAVSDPKDFLITLLNGVTAAALYFIVASGFTLIFGLMRVVNMAHGAFFLFGGYLALNFQRDMVGEGGALGLSSAQVSFSQWFLPLVGAGLIVGGVGLLMQQLFLRWNQGRTCGRRSSPSPCRSSPPTSCSPTTAASPRTSRGPGRSTSSSTFTSRGCSTR